MLSGKKIKIGSTVRLQNSKLSESQIFGGQS